MKRKTTFDKLQGVQQPLAGKVHQFRIREKYKEIHVPMRYGNILKEEVKVRIEATNKLEAKK